MYHKVHVRQTTDTILCDTVKDVLDSWLRKETHNLFFKISTFIPECHINNFLVVVLF